MIRPSWPHKPSPGMVVDFFCGISFQSQGDVAMAFNPCKDGCWAGRIATHKRSSSSLGVRLPFRSRLWSFWPMRSPDEARKVCLSLLARVFTIIQPLSSELPPRAAFVDILRASLICQMTHKVGTCQTCKQTSTTFSSRRSIPSADRPPHISGNASVYNDDNQRY